MIKNEGRWKSLQCCLIVVTTTFLSILSCASGWTAGIMNAHNMYHRRGFGIEPANGISRRNLPAGIVGVHLSSDRSDDESSSSSETRTKRYSFKPFSTEDIRRWLSGGHAYAIGDANREQNLQVGFVNNATTGESLSVVQMFMSPVEAENELRSLFQKIDVTNRPENDPMRNLCIKQLPMDTVWCNMIQPTQDVTESQPRYGDGRQVEDDFPKVHFWLKPTNQDIVFARRAAIMEQCPDALTPDEYRILSPQGNANQEEYIKVLEKMSRVTPKFRKQHNDIPVFYVDQLRLIVYNQEGDEFEVFPVFLDFVEMVFVCMNLTGDRDKEAHPEVWDIQVANLAEIVDDLSTGSSDIANFRISGLMHTPEDPFEVRAGSLRAVISPKGRK